MGRVNIISESHRYFELTSAVLACEKMYTKITRANKNNEENSQPKPNLSGHVPTLQ